MIAQNDTLTDESIENRSRLLSEEYELEPRKILFLSGNDAAEYQPGDPRGRNPTRVLLTKRNKGSLPLAAEVIEAELNAMFPNHSSLLQIGDVRSVTPQEILQHQILFISITARDFYAAIRNARIAISNKIPVVFGGPLATNDPELILSATNRLPAICQGRSEGILPDLLLTIQQDSHYGRIFLNTSYNPYSDYFVLGRENTKTRLLGPNTEGVRLEMGTGCALHCDFCAIPTFEIGARKTEGIIAELERLHKRGIRHVFFTDDNLAMRPPHQLAEVLGWINAHGMYWIGGSTRNIIYPHGKYDEKHARIIGQNNLLLLTGLEDGFSIQKSQPHQKDRTRSGIILDINRMIESGIVPYGSIVFGSDNHDVPVTLEYYRDLLFELNIPACIHIATPMHGTSWYERLLAENRITVNDISLYDFGNLVYTPKMDPKLLVQGVRWLQREISSPERVYAIISSIVKRTKNNREKFYDPRTRAAAFLAGLAMDAFWPGTDSRTPKILEPHSRSILNRYWPISST